MREGFTAGPPQGETAPLGGSDVREGGGRQFVLDTNIALDLWVFDEPAVESLRQALAEGAVWWATTAMRDELARVLAYPHIAARMWATAAAKEGADTGSPLPCSHADAVLARWDAAVTLQPVPPKARYVCTDADDQKFIDLAAAQAPVPPHSGQPVVLVSKDKAVLRLRKRLSTLGVTVLRTWAST